LARLVEGWEAWSVSTTCAVCGSVILAYEKAYVEEGKAYHERCYPGGSSVGVLRGVEEGAGGEFHDPEGEVVLTREQRRALWSLARSIVDEALRAAGVRHPEKFSVDGLGANYAQFILAVRERVSDLIKPEARRRIEFRLETWARGFGDTHIFLDGVYLYTWRPQFDRYVSAFWGWVRRVYNLLKTLAEMGMLREEAFKPPAKPEQPAQPEQQQAQQQEEGGVAHEAGAEVPREEVVREIIERVKAYQPRIMV